MAKKSVAKNYIFNLLYQLLTIVTPLITTPYVARVLGVENNGIYGYTISIVTYFVLFGSLGTALYGQREIAYVQNDRNKQTNVFWEILSIKTIAYLIVIIAFYLMFCLNGDYSLFYKILIIELVANLIDISWFFQGNEEFDKTVIRNMIVKITGLVCVFLFVKSENDLWKYFLIYVLSDLLGNLSLWMYVPRYLEKNDKKKLHLKKHVKPIILLFLPQISVQIYAVLDKTMLGQLTKSMSEVAYYDQAQKIIKALLLVVSAMSTVMCSRVANSYAKNKINDVKKYLKQSVSMVWLIATPLVFGVFAVASEIVPIYFGNGYDAVIPLMCTTSFILIGIGLNNVTGVQYLIQAGKQNIFTLSVTVGAVINVILNLVLIKLFGTIGAVYSSVIAEFIILAIQLFYTKEVIAIKDIIYSSIKYLISGIVMYIVVILLGKILTPGLISLCIKILIGALIYCSSLLVMKDKFTIDIINQILQTLKWKKKEV